MTAGRRRPIPPFSDDDGVGGPLWEDIPGQVEHTLREDRFTTSGMLLFLAYLIGLIAIWVTDAAVWLKLTSTALELLVVAGIVAVRERARRDELE